MSLVEDFVADAEVLRFGGLLLLLKNEIMTRGCSPPKRPQPKDPVRDQTTRTQQQHAS